MIPGELHVTMITRETMFLITMIIQTIIHMSSNATLRNQLNIFIPQIDSLLFLRATFSHLSTKKYSLSHLPDFSCIAIRASVSLDQEIPCTECATNFHSSQKKIRQNGYFFKCANRYEYFESAFVLP